MERFNTHIISELIRDYQINTNNITTDEICKIIGVSTGALYSKNPTVKTLQLVAQFFGVKISVFFQEEYDPAIRKAEPGMRIYEKLVKTQENYIENLEKENEALQNEVSNLKKELASVPGYNVAAEPQPELKKK